MARPRRDGQPPAAPRKQKLSDSVIRKLQPSTNVFAVWDTYQRGLAVIVQPSGSKVFWCIYSQRGRPRWYRIAAANAVTLADARKLTSRVMFKVAEGHDPAAERQAERGQDSFEQLATQYVERYAKKKNKSYTQADALVRKHLLPYWCKLQAASITRADVKAMMSRIEAPIVANQVLAAASAIFAWAIREDILKVNPCHQVERNATKDRERILSDSEVKLFWQAFDDLGLLEGTALKLILLTGQRPGEVTNMRREHIVDGWWNLPGDPVPALHWPGTKNGVTHRVWIPAAALPLLAELYETGSMFATGRGKPIHRSVLSKCMQDICATLNVDRATPHDLRRTNGSAIAGLFGREAMDRILNHVKNDISSVYDRHNYQADNKKITETVAVHIMGLIEGKPTNVIAAQFKKLK